jgi:hypothetical protein
MIFKLLSENPSESTQAPKVPIEIPQIIFVIILIIIAIVLITLIAIISYQAAAINFYKKNQK